MPGEKRLIFGPFRVDLANECLWQGTKAIKLRPKAFAVLSHLLGHRGKLVTKEELLAAVWPDTFVSDTVLKVAVHQLREALEDDPGSPHYIETKHRRGYRFIGQLGAGGAMLGNVHQTPVKRQIPASPLADGASAPKVIGRDDALSRMRRWYDKMLEGERQIVFVTGEAGIGKTALVDTFARSIGSERSVLIGRGQCLELYGAGEAYLPVLEAIGRLCREHEEMVDVLRAHAPTWLLQMPSAVSPSDREGLRHQVFGATRDRMLREICDALESLASNQSLVLILEDLHWSDYSTLDLISYLASQRHPAHLMLIGTYRPVELIITGHPLKAVKQELLARQQCEELPVNYLDEDSVVSYLSIRFPVNRFPAGLAGLIHERSGGNPLFMVNAVDYLLAAGLIVRRGERWELAVEVDKLQMGVPDTIKQMIEKQLSPLGAEAQRTLEVASVAGAEFSTLAVAAGLREERAIVEARCDELARQRQFIRDCGVQELPNGEAVPRYGFIHDLYRNVLYERVSASRRVRLHRRIGERGKEVYGDRDKEIAAELAMHFERGRDYKRAAHYLQQTADNDIRRFAYREAVGLARRGLELLERLPDTPERARQELALQLTLGVPLIATDGYAAPQVGSAYLKARALCQQLGETPDVSEVLWGLWAFYIVRPELEKAREIAEESLRLAEQLPHPGLALRGHIAMEVTLVHLGEFASAIEHFGEALSLYDPERHIDDVFSYSQNPGVGMLCHAAWALWFLGEPDQAITRMQEALTLARSLSEPHLLAHAFQFAAMLHLFRRDERLAQECAEAALAISGEHGLTMYKALATMALGWALIEQGRKEAAVEPIRQGLAACQATGAEVSRPHFLGELAEALGAGQPEEDGLDALERALELSRCNGEACFDANLHRIKGELLVAQASGTEVSEASVCRKAVSDYESPVFAQAEACFHQAIKIAQQQKAKSWELRAAISLARLYKKQSRREEARVLLSQIYAKFTEGFDTTDLREAKALLAELQ